MTELELLKEAISKCGEKDTIDHVYIDKVNDHISNELKSKNINEDFNFIIYEAKNHIKYIYTYYTKTGFPVLQLDTYDLFRYYGLFVINDKSYLKDHTILYSTANSTYDTRDKNFDKYIYSSYKSNVPISDIAEKYTLSVHTVETIIQKQKEKCIEREEFLSGLTIYLENYDIQPKRLLNAINRYLFVKDIYTFNHIS